MSGLNSIYEQQFKKHKTNSDWGSLRPASASGKSDNKGKGKKPPREYPQPLFTLRRIKGESSRRSSYEIPQKLKVLEYSRLVCADGNVVGNRGAAAVFGLTPKILRNWAKQEGELKSSMEKAGSYHAGAAKTLGKGGKATTAEVEEEIVDEINILAKQGIAVNQDLVMAKLLSVTPTWRGGLPGDDKPQKAEKFRKQFGRWYYRFIKRQRFSIRRKTSVGQKKPEGWEGKAWAFIQKLRSLLLGHAKEAVLLQRAAAAAQKEGGTVEIDIEGSPVTAEELRSVQEKIFEMLYNIDQTPVQAEMPQETTLAQTGAKDARIATGGEESFWSLFQIISPKNIISPTAFIFFFNCTILPKRRHIVPS